MNQRELKFLLKFKAEQRALLRARENFKKLAAAERRIAAGAKEVTATTTAASKSVSRFGAASVKASAAASAGFARLRAALVRVGALLGTLGLGIGLGVAISTVAQFGAAMSRVQAITGELERDLSGKLNPTFAAISETVRRLGATTVFTASQAAGAFGLLAQAGFDAGEAIAATSAVLDLAVVGAIDLGSSANFVSNAIRGFGLSASEAGRVADVFAATITRSNTDVTQLGEALKFVAPIARSMGIEIEEAAAAIGILSNAGLKGTLAGTGLRRVLVGLASQTPKATRTLEGLGINIEKLQEAIDGGGGLNEALEEFEGRQLSAAQAVEVFGLRGGPAFLVLQRLTKETGTFTEALKQAEDEAQQFAEIARDNLAGDLKILRSVIEDSILGTGGLNKAFREITQTLTGVIQVFAGTLNPLDENAQRYRDIAETVRFVIAGIKALTIAFIAFKASLLIGNILKAVNVGIGLLGKTTKLATGGVAGLSRGLRFFKTALVATGIGAFLIIAGELLTVFTSLGDEFDRVNGVIETARAPFERAAIILDRLDGLAGRLALQQLPGLRTAFEDASAGLKSLTDERDRIVKLADGLDQVGVASGSIGLFRVIESEELTKAEKLGIVLKGLLPGFTIGGVAADAMRERLGPLATAIGLSTAEVEQFDAALKELEGAQRAFDELDKAGVRLKDLGKEIGDVRKTLAGFADQAEKGLKDIDVRISDLKLPTDIDRKIASELRDAGLEVVLPVELRTAREEAIKLVAEAERELAAATAAATEVRTRSEADLVAARISGNAKAALSAKAAIEETDGLIDQAEVQLVNAKNLEEQSGRNISKRKEEIATITDRVTEEQKLIEAGKAIEAVEKLITKTRSDGLSVDERVKVAQDELIESNETLRDAGLEVALTEEELANALVAVEKNTRRGTTEWKAYSQAVRNAQTAQEQFDAEIKKLNASFQLQINSIGKTTREIEELAFKEDLLLKAEKTVAREIGETNEAFRKRQLAARDAAQATVEFTAANRRAAMEAERLDITGAARRSLEQFVDASTNAAKITEQAFSTAFSALDTQLKSFVKTGVFDFREFALTILDEIAVLAAKAAIATALRPLIGGAGGGGIGAIVAQGLGLVAPGQEQAPAGAGPGIAGQAAGAAAGAAGVGGMPGEAGVVAEILERGFGTLKGLGEKGLEVSAQVGQTLLTGITTALTFLGSVLSTVFTAVGAFLGTVFTAVTTAASFVISGAVTAGSFFVATAVQVGSFLINATQLVANAIAAVGQGFLAIIAAFAPIPFFHGGGVTTGGGSGTRQVPASAFLGARRFQAGGISDEDNIPALLAPGEAVVPLAGGAIPVQITPTGDQAPTREPRQIIVQITVNANDADSFVESQQEIATRMAEEIRAAEERNR